MNVLELKKVSKSYLKDLPTGFAFFNLLYALLFNRQILSMQKRLVLKDVSFDLKRGEVLGLRGNNGSGKSTLLRIIAGIYKSDSGEIIINGSILYFSGYLEMINKNLTVEDNFYHVSRMYGISDEIIESKIKTLLDEVGLSDYLDKKTKILSSGMLSRLGFVISHFVIEQIKPDILLLDEVLTGWGDENFQKYSEDKIQGLLKRNYSIIFISHNLEQLKKICHRILILENGVIK